MASQAKLSRVAINRILLATDFSTESQNALQYALSLSKHYDSTLVLTHIVPPESAILGGETRPAVGDLMWQDAKESMAQLEQTEELKSIRHEVILQSGDTGDVISKITADSKIDMIITGTHGWGGVKKLALGSIAESVIRHASCPVMTVGPHVELMPPHRFARILYATDFSSGSAHALSYAVSLAEDDRAELTVLHVIATETPSESELMEWRRQDCEKLNHLLPAGLDLAYQPEIEVECGIPDVEIVRLANTKKADLVVMGSHSGGTVSTHLPWTTLHSVLQNASCPVLTVRGEYTWDRAEQSAEAAGVSTFVWE